MHTSSLTIVGTTAVESNTYSCTVKPSSDDPFVVVSTSASFFRTGQLTETAHIWQVVSTNHPLDFSGRFQYMNCGLRIKFHIIRIQSPESYTAVI